MSLKTLTQEEANEQNINFVFFAYNYPAGWVKAAFQDHYVGSKHFEDKFTSLYNRFGSYSVVYRFFGELSNDNKELVLNWVRENYNHKS